MLAQCTYGHCRNSINYYEYCAFNIGKNLQRKIVKYTRSSFILKYKASTCTISVNKTSTFRIFSKKSLRKIKFLKRACYNTFETTPFNSYEKSIRFTLEKNISCSKVCISSNMRSKHLQSLFSTFLYDSRIIYVGDTDYLSSKMSLCYIVFETLRLISRRLPFLKRNLKPPMLTAKSSPSPIQPPESFLTPILTPESFTSTIDKKSKKHKNRADADQQSMEKIHSKSLKKKKRSFSTKLPEDSTISEQELDELFRQRLKHKKKSSVNDSEFQHFRPKRIRPNYFVAVQVSDPKIQESVHEIQQHILTQDNHFDDCMISILTLHITLMVMNICDEEMHEKAMQALSNIHKEHNDIMCKNPLKLEFCGLGHFHNRVLFGKMIENESYTRLCQLADSVEKNFAEFEIFSTDEKRNFNPHLTIAKLKMSSRNKREPKKINPSLYYKFIDNYLGSATIHSIQLLRMSGPKDSTGYYTGQELLFQM